MTLSDINWRFYFVLESNLKNKFEFMNLFFGKTFEADASFGMMMKDE